MFPIPARVKDNAKAGKGGAKNSKLNAKICMRAPNTSIS